MYCQNCGTKIEGPGFESCQYCGQKLVRSDQAFPWRALFFTIIFALGVLAIYLLRPATGEPKLSKSVDAEDGGRVNRKTAPVMVEAAEAEPTSSNSAGGSENSQFALPVSYQLPVSYGNVGPQLLESGAIDLNRFVKVYEQAGSPLDDSQLAILTEGSDSPIVIDRSNSYFLLNFLWALGLTNQNPLLDAGPLQQYSEGEISRFASTGGWTIGKRKASDLYSSASIVPLKAEEQERLEKVAYNVYRPCCDNHTAFADCNHGMAMLGLLELMAGQGASEEEMFEAAKQVNSFWFPQQALETAIFFQAALGLEYDDVNGQMASGREVFSGSGFRSVHQWLTSNGKLEPAPESGGSCGV